MTYSLTVLVVYLGLDIIGFYRAFFKNDIRILFCKTISFSHL